MKADSIVFGLLLCTSLSCSLLQTESTNSDSNVSSTKGEAMNASASQKDDQQAKDAALVERKKAVLVERYLNSARQMMASGQYGEAEREIKEALNIEPANAAAQRLMGDLSTMKNSQDQSGEASNFKDDMEKRWNLQVQALRAEAMDALNRGKAALAERNYHAAVQDLNVVLNHIKWAPVKADWGNMESEARALLDQAQAARQAEMDAMRKSKEEATFRKLKEAEAQELARKKEMIRNMLVSSIDAYDSMKFEECVEICDRIIEMDPHVSDARDLREAAFRSARDKSKMDYISKKREEFRVWREDLLETRIPYTEFMTLPDKEYWNEITKRRAKRNVNTNNSTETDEIRRLKEVVKTTTIPSLNVKDETELDNVIGIIRTYTGLPIIVDPAASDAVRSGSITFTLPIENPISVKDSLEIITEITSGQIAYVFKHDAILITTAEKAKGRSVVRNHDIQDLVFSLTDFHGPNLAELAEATSGQGGKSEGSPFGSVGPEPKTIVDPQELTQLIKETIAPGTWDQDGHRLEAFNGNLVVVHNEDVQKSIENFLNDLRKFSSAIVTIETKFLTVSENFIQEIGVEFRGGESNGVGSGTLANLDDVTNGLEDNASRGFDNGGPGISNGAAAADNPAAGLFFKKGKDDIRAHTENIFDNPLGNVLSTNGGATFQLSLIDDLQVNMLLRMIEKSANFRLVNSSTISTHNGQRAYVTVINQTSYIADFEVEVATAAFIADPKIAIIPDGVSLDVRPIIHQNRKYITLELQPTVATLIRPIQEIQTTLAGISNPVTIQLPELQVSSASTTAVVPDGGSILIGGLKKIRNVERKSQIPWLAQIPILGAFAKSEGVNEENETLMVLIRAYITDVKEEAKKIAGVSR